MSDDDRDNDIENDADILSHHNALEMNRREEDSFSKLRDALPAFQDNEVQASKTQIVNEAADYILRMRKKNSAHSADIENLRQQNNEIEDQIRSLEEAEATNNLAAASAILEDIELNFKADPTSAFDGESNSGESSDNTDGSKDGSRKRLKPNTDESSDNTDDSKDGPRKILEPNCELHHHT